ncbi:type II toxin-antitoxin system RatA family toxin [Rhizobacter sp. J219]|jgi:ribosome-associated toxin RatA of RatAB toxin-antitoxin module|uniref:type II toxin-antitoxin system RatA family toxin n=1 Tax=Rhizobacter sp. J219 TaxID=2898430 RepID=UPI0021510984|nr:type II toxin-antitoxin system RatA family toxin [Rhizobacter sp. J219]MCR5882583.1 type II toxin-antitoxin system RatA family toxin [Rhizobacter sp. J219]
MKQVRKSVLLTYSAPEMYALVVDIPSYPRFLPWCEKAEVLTRDDAGMTAKLHLAYGGLRHAFTTRNSHVADSSVTVSLVDGPFSVLDGSWRFVPLVLPGAQPEPACKIEFDLRYAFSSRPLELVVSPVFDKVANTFVDAFVKRATQVYGER